MWGHKPKLHRQDDSESVVPLLSIRRCCAHWNRRVLHVISDEASKRADGQIIFENSNTVLKSVGQSRRSEQQHTPGKTKDNTHTHTHVKFTAETQRLKMCSVNLLGANMLLGYLQICDVSKSELFSQQASGLQKLIQTSTVRTWENTYHKTPTA